MDPLKPGDPTAVGRYRLVGRLGEGGMGRVFLGVSPGGRQVAVKLIHSSHATDRQFRERFTREIEAARKVGGFHTASVVDADPAADPPWMVTAYIHGSSLQEAVRERGPFSLDGVCALGAGLAEGLAAIHACGLVHRDLKPSNVILAEDGPRIIDFGIARATGASRMTTAGMVVGTYSYMSPEQVRGEMAGPASDVFSLGCTLAFAATAQSPFGDDSIITVVYRITSEPPDLSHVPTERGLRQLIGECLAKNPGDRPSLNDILTRLTQAGPAVGFVTGPVPGYVSSPQPPYTPGPVSVPPAGRSDAAPSGGPAPSDAVPAPSAAGVGASGDKTSPPANLYAPTHTMRSGENVAQEQVADLQRSGSGAGSGSGVAGGYGRAERLQRSARRRARRLRRRHWRSRRWSPRLRSRWLRRGAQRPRRPCRLQRRARRLRRYHQARWSGPDLGCADGPGSTRLPARPSRPGPSGAHRRRRGRRRGGRGGPGRPADQPPDAAPSFGVRIDYHPPAGVGQPSAAHAALVARGHPARSGRQERVRPRVRLGHRVGHWRQQPQRLPVGSDHGQAHSHPGRPEQQRRQRRRLQP